MTCSEFNRALPLELVSSSNAILNDWKVPKRINCSAESRLLVADNGKRMSRAKLLGAACFRFEVLEVLSRPQPSTKVRPSTLSTTLRAWARHLDINPLTILSGDQAPSGASALHHSATLGHPLTL